MATAWRSLGAAASCCSVKCRSSQRRRDQGFHWFSVTKKNSVSLKHSKTQSQRGVCVCVSVCVSIGAGACVTNKTDWRKLIGSLVGNLKHIQRGKLLLCACDWMSVSCRLWHVDVIISFKSNRVKRFWTIFFMDGFQQLQFSAHPVGEAVAPQAVVVGSLHSSGYYCIAAVLLHHHYSIITIILQFWS